MASFLRLLTLMDTPFVQHIRIVAGLLLVALLGACERPFVEVGTPTIEILEPDISQVLVEPEIALSVKASSFRPVDRVTFNGVPMRASADGKRWEININLRLGLNTLIFEAVDIEDVAGVDTSFAVYLPFQFALNAPRLPEARGGHTTTPTRSRGLLVTGGADRVGGPARAEAFLLPPGGTAFSTARGRLNEPRTGHTASQLPSGQVLILGGSRTDALSAIDHLVESAEIYDPETDIFFEIPVVGDPIRRAMHTAVLRNENTGLLVDLFGGRGDTRYGSDPFLGVRSDLRTFQVRDDTLFALNSLASAPRLDDAIFGHTESRIQVGPYFVYGSYFDGGFADQSRFRLDYSPTGIRISDAPPMRVHRTRHAAAPVLNNLLVLFGGRQGSASDILIDAEVLSDYANQFFQMPRLQPIVRRFAHTATAMSSRNVLIVGGFGSSGTAYAASEFFSVRAADPVY